MAELESTGNGVDRSWAPGYPRPAERVLMTGMLVSITVLMLQASPSTPPPPPLQAQPCAADRTLTAEQTARRRQGVVLARTVHNLQINQPGAAARKYFAQQDLGTSPFMTRLSGEPGEFRDRLNFTPGAEILPGWELKLDVTSAGYWFLIKDKTDPCGLTFVSNEAGVILQARPLQ
jgi:hypothetical protein